MLTDFCQSAQDKQLVVAAGAVPALVHCLQLAANSSSDSSRVRTTMRAVALRSGGLAAHALGHLVQDSPEHQAAFEKAGALAPLLKILEVRGRHADSGSFELKCLLFAVHQLAGSKDWRRMAASSMQAVLGQLAEHDSSAVRELSMSALTRIQQEVERAAAAEAALLEAEEGAEQQQQQPQLSTKAAKRQRQRQRAAAAGVARRWHPQRLMRLARRQQSQARGCLARWRQLLQLCRRSSRPRRQNERCLEQALQQQAGRRKGRRH